MSSKSLEELLSILGEEAPKEQIADDVALFIEALEIKASQTEKVPARIIYWFYMKWKENNGGLDVVYSRLQFFLRFSKFFEKGRTEQRYYRIESGKFKVLRWDKEEIQRDLKLERKRNRQLKRKRQKEKRPYKKRNATLLKPQG